MENRTYRIDIDPDELQAVGMTQAELTTLFDDVDGYHIYINDISADTTAERIKEAENKVTSVLEQHIDDATQIQYVISGGRTF